MESLMANEWIDQVLQFWFHELSADAWFRKDERVDADIRERFGILYERLAAVPEEKLGSPRASVAAVIVLDQFPRNMFRNTPRAFATDAKALSLAERAIAAGFDQLLSKQERMFLYMPLQHSENAAVQARSIRLFTELHDESTLGYAQKHKDVIDRFGRFPHRNVILQRASTPDELIFLQDHPGF